MSEKCIYFVRHGETSGNVGKRHQPEHTRLTIRGKAQAEAVGARIAAVAPTHFFVSSQVRAVETARLMSSHLTVEPQTSDLFMELIRPTAIHGRKHRSVASLWYIFMWFFGRRGAAGESAEGESRTAFYSRLREAQQLLEALPQDARVVVVSHSVFINLFIDMVCRGGRPWFLSSVGLFIRILIMPNTAVTQLVYTEAGGWRRS